MGNALRTPGRPLARSVRDTVEERLAYDFGRVRVHTDARAAASARALHAKAYTAGSHVVFGAGWYQPESADGRRLLMHELTHVAQQGGREIAPAGLQLGPVTGQLEEQATAGERGGPGEAPVRAASGAAGVIQRAPLPAERFTPAPGLLVDRTANSIEVAGAMEMSGPEATPARAASAQVWIRSTWNQTFPDGASARCTVTVTFRPPTAPPNAVAQIEASDSLAPSQVYGSMGRYSMHLNANEPRAFEWVAAHEFGHMIGFEDRYDESVGSRLKREFGFEGSGPPKPGYENNVMGATLGELERKNIAEYGGDVARASGDYNADVRIRDWVHAHSLAEVGRLSTDEKLRAIGRLLRGYVSPGDLTAVVRICQSVTTPEEGAAIRAAVTADSLTGGGQRAALRAALARMP